MKWMTPSQFLLVLLAVGYAIGQLSLGLLLHPYQTMQQLVEDKVFVWLVLLPTGFLGVVTIIWRWLVVPGVRLLFSCQPAMATAASPTNYLLSNSVWQPLMASSCQALPFFSNWLTFFMIYWQILLLYLLFRFHMAYSVDE